MDPTIAGRSRLLIAEIDKKVKQEKMEDTLFLRVQGEVLDVATESNMFYSACRDCKKRVTPETNGWYCDRCNRLFHDCRYTYQFVIKIGDMSGAINANVIGNAVGEALFGITAENLREIQREKNLSHVTQFMKGSGAIDFDDFIKSF